MRRRGQFQPAAHDGALHRRDNRQPAILDQVECAVPVAGNIERLVDIAFLVLGEVEAGAEMIAVRPQHDGERFAGRRAEETVDVLDQRFVDRISFLGTVQRQDGNTAAHLEVDQVGCKCGHGIVLRMTLDRAGEDSISGLKRGVNSATNKNSSNGISRGETG